MTERSHILIVEARFYEDIADDLANGAIAVLDQATSTHERLFVPGVFEVPAAIRFALRAAEQDRITPFDGVIALGCVIRGETDHYDHICREASRALMDLSVEQGVALGFGILTCETMAQARARAAPDQKDKGADAAKACLRMISIKRALGVAPQ
ncbi:MAG: 6,7-dimethyl-8-ribityllumazine synthase [Rhodospirillales bacterium]|nr:6,7-dimethyl-8-ribityllumazine synthase [Rhodospirillales bacterium]